MATLGLDDVSEPSADGATGGGDLTDALARCYAHLGRREHSVMELRARLERARFDEHTIEQALATVIDQGYLDDARYARLLAEDRRTIDGWGVDRIRAALVRAGVEREVIEATVAPFDAASECDRAIELLRRRFRAPPRADSERQRAFALLIRQGYDSEVAYDAIRRYES